MLRASTVATFMVAGLAVAACGTDSSSATLEPGTGPSFRSEHSPPGPGAQVSHGRGGFFVTFKQPGAPYFIAVGVTPEEAADFCSGGDPDFAPSRDLFVEGPNGNIHGVFKSDGKVPLSLYPPDTEDICSGTPVAQGSGIYTDNGSNIFGGNGRGNTGFRIRGQVTDLAGDRHHVLVVVRQHLGPNGFEDLVVKVSVN
jgi:hypothetical protein